MSRAHVVEAQEIIQNSDNSDLHDATKHLGVKDIRFAVEGIVLQEFFRNQAFHDMQVELVSLEIPLTPLGLDIRKIQDPIVTIVTNYLNSVAAVFFNNNPAILDLCNTKSINATNLFSATETGIKIMIKVARDTIARSSNSEEFTKRYRTMVNGSLNIIAAHSAQILDGDFINFALFDPPPYLNHKLKKFFYTQFTDEVKFIDSLRKILYSDDFTEDLNEDAIANIQKARDYVGKLDPTAYRYLASALIETLPDVNGSIDLESLDWENMHSITIEILNYTIKHRLLEDFPSLFDILADYNDSIDPELLSELQYTTEIETIRPAYYIEDAQGMGHINIDLLKRKVKNNRGGKTPLEVEKELKASKMLRQNGCPGLHERTSETNSNLGQKVNMIDISAHAIATVITRNWDLIQEKGIL